MRAAILGLLAVGACQSAFASARKGSELPVVRLSRGPYAFTAYSGLADSTRLVIRDSSAWRAVWRDIHRPFIPAPALPSVDFQHEAIVVAALGTRPTEGYDIVIEQAAEDSSEVTISLRASEPGGGCLVNASITQPVDVARIPATDRPVRFRQRNVVMACGVR